MLGHSFADIHCNYIPLGQHGIHYHLMEDLKIYNWIQSVSMN